VFTRMLHGLEQGDVRALHRTRVASRRLRELIPILQLDRALTRKLVRRLRKVTDRLGAVRELDVLLLLLDELQDSGRSDEKARRQVIAAIADDRGRARDALLEKLPISELRRLAARLEDVASSLEPGKGAPNTREEAASRWALEARVAHRAERLSRALREAGAVYLPERLHVVRIALKKLRYAVELRDDGAGAKATGRRDVATLKRSQDILGRMHDLQVLMDRVRQVQAELTSGRVQKWDELDAMIGRLEDDCRRLHARFMRERPALAAICAQAMGRSHAAAERRAMRRQFAS
jgi:CHAD domain-containing protein